MPFLQGLHFLVLIQVFQNSQLQASFQFCRTQSTCDSMQLVQWDGLVTCGRAESASKWPGAEGAGQALFSWGLRQPAALSVTLLLRLRKLSSHPMCSHASFESWWCPFSHDPLPGPRTPLAINAQVLSPELPSLADFSPLRPAYKPTPASV